MPVDVIMPALGMSQETGLVVRWLKEIGDEVAKGEPLLEIETDKAVVEVEAPAGGRLASVLAVAGDSVPVGRPVALIAAPGEELPEQPAVRPPAGPPDQAEAETPRAGPVPGAETAPADHGPAARPRPEPGADGGGGRLRPASPRARQRAAAAGIDIQAVAGTGPDGAVIARDIEAAGAEEERQVAPPGGSEVSRTWRVMAERTTAAWATPHFYLAREAVADRLVGWRAALERRGLQVTFTDLLVKLIGVTLKAHPEANRRWVDGRLESVGRIGVGIAAAIEEGLVVPVLQDADSLPLGDIAQRRGELLERARNRRLSPGDLAGGSITLSNLGMYGIDGFTAILNGDQAAILAVGRIAERPVAEAGRVVVKPTIVLTLGCDHRVLDGARGARFLQDLVEAIEEPALMWEAT